MLSAEGSGKDFSVKDLQESILSERAGGRLPLLDNRSWRSRLWNQINNAIPHHVERGPRRDLSCDSPQSHREGKQSWEAPPPRLKEASVYKIPQRGDLV